MNDDEIEFKEHLKKISGQGVDLYLEGKPEYILRKELHYSRSRFWKLKQEALIWFAEIFAPYYDLRVKK